MKKLIALFLVVVFASVSTIGCGDTKPTTKAGGATTPPGGAPVGGGEKK
ncbi:MAG: hypothetical protein ACYC3I_23125 [Gemmataceae bacterium]